MLAYTDIGKGMPIVLIHGLGSRKEAWKPQHVLADRFRLIIPDLRGHGETELEEDISMKNFALDVINLLKELKISYAYVCGISLGGMVAQEMCKQEPNMIRGLILANSTSYIYPFFANEAIIKTKEILEQGRKDELLDFMAKKSIDNQEYIQEAKNAFLIRDSYIESAKAPVGINYFTTILNLNKPILIISSLNDKVVPAVNQFIMWCTCNRNSEIKPLEGGHLSNIEQKEKFNNLIIDFIGGR